MSYNESAAFADAEEMDDAERSVNDVRTLPNGVVFIGPAVPENTSEPDYYAEMLDEQKDMDVPAQNNESPTVIELLNEARYCHYLAVEHDRDSTDSRHTRRWLKRQASKTDRRAGKLICQEAV